MDKIHVLPQDVINQIAAGEVVERPASVVKELAENSIDARATKISVETEEAGLKLIRVTDNGAGMSKNDAKLAIERHTTSKIKNFSDLSSLKSMGFRGEALSSISGVSRFRLVTKEKEALAGFELIVEGSKIKNARECPHAGGTMVEVSSLFFNVPARKKFLKSAAVEQAHVTRVLEEIALANPEIGFSVKINSRPLFNAPPATKFGNRILDILGSNFFENLLSCEYNSGGIKITAFVSRLSGAYPNKNAQYFFVNKRPVSNRALSQALYSAYKDSLPVGRHPAAIIMMEVNPATVDVNVHPGKKQVKFSDEREIFDALSLAVRECLTSQPAPSLAAVEIKTASKKHPILNTESPQQNILSFSGASSQVSEKPAATYGPAEKRIEAVQQSLLEEFHILGHLHDTYVLIETPGGLVIMDQHAANERVLYERFLDQSLSAQTSLAAAPVQKLLIPLTMELMPHESGILSGCRDDMNTLGFETSEFGKNTVIFKAVPAIFGNISQLKDFLKNFIALLMDDFTDKNSLSLKPVEKIIRASCRAAVKASDKVSIKETQEIINGLKNCAQPMCCPHGRPTMINITINELEKKFRRI